MGPLCLCVLVLCQGLLGAAAVENSTSTEALARTSVETTEPARKLNNTAEAKFSAKNDTERNKQGTIKSSVTTFPPDGSTELKTLATKQTCNARKAQRSLKFQIDECYTESSVFGPKRRTISVDRETRETILSLYSGMFHTSQEASELEQKRKSSKVKSRRVGRSTETSDGNICCPSLSVLVAAPSQMVNTYLETRNIVHFEDDGLYQYIHKGYCVDTSEQACSGLCVSVTRVVYLLVWKDPLPTDSTVMPMTFEPFEIPSFCSCQNVSV